jgi:cholest-4-en-3-one 26-monooxygenase
MEPARMTTIDPATLDVATPAHYQAHGYPHPEWTWLRRNDPVFWYDRENVNPFWVVTKHADIVALSKQPRRFLNAPRLAVFMKALAPPPEGSTRHLLNMDPPDHASYRRITSTWFTPRAVDRMKAKVARVAREIIDAAAEKEGGDFVADVSAPLTIAVIAEMLGGPKADWGLLFRWSNEIIAPEDPDFQLGKDAFDTAQSARMEIFSYFHDLAEQRRSDPRDDITTVVVAGQHDGEELPIVELLSYFMLLVVAGNETTRNAMTGGVLAMLENPGEWEKLRRDASLIPSAVEETVRWVTPVIQFCRTATEDSELRGKKIRRGDNLCLFYPSANRDEDVFEDPFAFRIDRQPNPHIAFGIGEHVCLGAHLARLEIAEAYAQLRERVESMELSAPFERARSSFVGGIKSAPMRWKIRPGGSGA